tara:strand:- start:1242 stop:1520 length:279 start_codon:yes stop_codon:yes gene_type:complete
MLPPFVTSIMTHSIELNVIEHLQKKYPKLTWQEIDIIATDVSNRWDYRDLIDNVDFKCKQTAYYANIELGDNDYNEGLNIKYEPLEHTSEGC